MKIQIDSGLSFHVTLQDVCCKGRNIHCLVKRTIQSFCIILYLFFPLFLRQKALLHPCRRTDLGKHTFHIGESSCKHSKSMRHGNFIFLHHFHQILHNFRNIDITHINRSIFCHQIIDIFIQLALIRLSAELAKCHHRFLDQTDVILCHTFDCIADLFPVTLGKSSHHSHINPDNLSITDTHIARMRISMKKTVLHNLANVIIYKLCSNLIQIIAICQQIFFIVGCKSINIFHH